MKSVRYALPLAAFLALCLLFVAMIDRDTQLLPSPLLNKPIPEFSLQNLEQDKAITPKEFEGKKWLLNVWASWCAECRIEHPLFNALAEETNWTLVGLNYKDQQADAKQWLESMKNPYAAIIFDKTGSLGLDLGVYGVPETFLINEQGIIVYKHVGAICQEIIDNVVTPFFANSSNNSTITPSIAENTKCGAQ